MGETVYVLRSRQLVFVRYSGTYAIGDVLRAFDRIAEHPDFHPEMDLLHDMRQVSGFEVSVQELAQVASLARGEYTRRRSPRRTAVIASDRPMLSVVKAFERMVATHPMVEFRGFLSEVEAAEFLGISDMQPLLFSATTKPN